MKASRVGSGPGALAPDHLCCPSIPFKDIKHKIKEEVWQKPVLSLISCSVMVSVLDEVLEGRGPATPPFNPSLVEQLALDSQRPPPFHPLPTECCLRLFTLHTSLFRFWAVLRVKIQRNNQISSYIRAEVGENLAEQICALAIWKSLAYTKSSLNTSGIKCVNRWAIGAWDKDDELSPNCKYNWKVLVTQSHPTLGDPMDCSPPGSSVHGILQARILEWVPFPSPGIFPTQGLIPGLLHCRQILYCLSHQGKLENEGTFICNMPLSSVFYCYWSEGHFHKGP